MFLSGLKIPDEYLVVSVKNLHGTEGRVPPTPDENLSWKAWWEKRTGKTFGKCSCSSCQKEAEVGAHVIMDSMDDRKWYIVPLCKGCNKKEEAFSVSFYNLVAIHGDTNS